MKMKTYDTIFSENVLNKFDSFTYNWTMSMVHPNEAHKFEENNRSDRVVVLAHSGVESETGISITSSFGGLQHLLVGLHHLLVGLHHPWLVM